MGAEDPLEVEEAEPIVEEEDEAKTRADPVMGSRLGKAEPPLDASRSRPAPGSEQAPVTLDLTPPAPGKAVTGSAPGAPASSGLHAPPASVSAVVPARAMSSSGMGRGSDASISMQGVGGPQMVDLAAGTVLAGRYRIERLIAKGGMGRVYLATQIPLERRVAVKLLAPRADAVADPQFVRRFYLEAAICARLSHPNIVTVHDYGETDNGVLFMAMEYLDGMPISTAIKEQGAFAPDRVLAIATQVCRGLREAHARGIVHRDLKPGNIMLLRGRDEDNSDLVKVLDFGLVKVYETEAEASPITGELGDSFDLTRAGILLGSPRYMSPEQIRNEHLDPRTDIYSLGVILYQMTSARTPFNGKTSVDILHQHLHMVPPPITGAPPELLAIIGKCMEKQRENRYPTINELLRDLKTAARNLGGAANAASVPAAAGAASAGMHGHSASMSYSDISNSASNRSLDSLSASSLQVSSGSIESQRPVSALAEPVPSPSGDISASGPVPVQRTRDPALDESTSDHLAAAKKAVESEQRKSTRLVFILGAIAAVLAGGIGAYLALGHGEPPREAVKELPRPPAPTLLIDSHPAGATVSEAGRVLGRTPLVLTLDPEETNARSFEIAMNGYVTQVLRQPPEKKDARVLAELIPLPPPEEKPPEEKAPEKTVEVRHPIKKPPAAKVKPSKTEPANEQVPPDIRMAR